MQMFLMAISETSVQLLHTTRNDQEQLTSLLVIMNSSRTIWNVYTPSVQELFNVMLCSDKQ